MTSRISQSCRKPRKSSMPTMVVRQARVIGLRRGDQRRSTLCVHFERGRYCCQWQHKRERSVFERDGPVRCIPLRSSSRLCVYQNGDATDFGGRQQAPSASRKNQLSAKALALTGKIDRQTSESKNGHIVSGQPFFQNIGRDRILQRSRTETVEAKNRFPVRARNRQKRFGRPSLVVLSSMLLQEIVEGRFPAVKRATSCFFEIGSSCHSETFMTASAEHEPPVSVSHWVPEDSPKDPGHGDYRVASV